ncbi:DUF2157 domain-containing protein [Anaeromyxobacter terrae]|uniref:DUF2157 domain-containing protein n=1 Tax=Anaeromyxobacter terrae TaxID=2925406 RepID=UPI001F58ABD2|nr:DUF2157 domain-containing protein [Anaeromyxobacter sp. SG22]
MERASRGFREGLRRELPAWRTEGLVSEETARALAVRYDLARAEPGGPSFLAVYVLGALLVGAGVVSLVAWHWEAMSAGAKLGTLGAAMAAAHLAGFVLWKGTGRSPRLGHALTVLGTLVFGASIGLVAQIFHVSGAWWGAFGAFTLGALAAAFLYDSLPHLILAAVAGLWLFGPGLADDHGLRGIALGYAGAAAVAGLAWRARSRALLVVGAIGVALTLASALDALHADAAIVPMIAALGAALAAAALVVRDPARLPLSAAARLLGRLAFYGAAYFLSFHEVASHLRLEHGVTRDVALGVVPLLAAAGAALASGLRRDDVDPLARGEAMLLAATVVAVVAGLSLEAGRGAVLVANLALAFLAIGRIVRGLSWLARGPFWEGMAVAGVLVASRFLEIETRLWLKGAAFIACGVLVLVAGVAFERRRAHREEVDHALA